MRFSLIVMFLVLLNISAFGKFTPPVNDEIINAINIPNTSAFCSDDAAYNNLEATESSYNKGTN